MFNHALREARIRVNKTIPQAAFDCGHSESQYSRFEAGTHAPKPDSTLTIAVALEAPELIYMHCRHNCPIGQKYSYDVPRPSEVSLADVVLELWKETDEARATLLRLRSLVIGKTNKADFSQEELDGLRDSLREYLDIEKALAKAKVKLMSWFDISEDINSQKGIKKEPDKGSEKLFAYV